jgi:hypothetical protein
MLPKIELARTRSRLQKLRNKIDPYFSTGKSVG